LRQLDLSVARNQTSFDLVGGRTFHVEHKFLWIDWHAQIGRAFSPLVKTSRCALFSALMVSSDHTCNRVRSRWCAGPGLKAYAVTLRCKMRWRRPARAEKGAARGRLYSLPIPHIFECWDESRNELIGPFARSNRSTRKRAAKMMFAKTVSIYNCLISFVILHRFVQ
jgi:hypothetical protein